MPKLTKNPTIFIRLAAILFSGYYFFALYQFVTKSYFVEEDQLYRVGNFQLLNRAHEQSDRGRPHTYNSKLVFQSKDYYSFRIDENIFRAIIDKKELEDTMMYAGLKFTVYTDNENFNNYQKAKEPINVRVFQFEIGDKKYIDIAELNRLNRAKALMNVVFWPGFILSIWFFLSNKIIYSAKQRFIIICVAWIIIFTGLILMR